MAKANRTLKPSPHAIDQQEKVATIDRFLAEDATAHPHDERIRFLLSTVRELITGVPSDVLPGFPDPRSARSEE